MVQEVAVAKLMHKKSYIVFGRIDFFSAVQYLIIFLGGCLELERNLFASQLSKVGKGFRPFR